MAGLFGYAAVGALGGLGEGLTEQANDKREDKLRQIELALRKSERTEDRAWQVEDRNFNAAQARSRAASSRKSSVKFKPLSTAEMDRIAKKLDLADGGADPARVEAYVSEFNRRKNDYAEAGVEVTFEELWDETFGTENKTPGTPGKEGGWFGIGAEDPTEPTGTGTWGKSEDTAGKALPAPENPDERVVGQVYTSPSGKKGRWTANGWELVD